MDNAEIAQTLEAYAALLDVAGATKWAARAYRRAGELVRDTPAPVAELVREGRVRELRGIGEGIEKKLAELVATGRIEELEELQQRVEPAAVAKALARRQGRERRGLLLSRARVLAAELAEATGAVVAGDVRRGTEVAHELALVSPLPDALDLLAAHPLVVAVLERDDRRALAVTAEGIPVELVVAPAARYGTELVRATGSPEHVAALGELPDAPTEEALYTALGLPLVPPELREGPPSRVVPELVVQEQIRGDLHCHTTWSDGKASVLEMAEAASELGYEYLAICDHTPNVRVVPGLDADALRRQAEEIAAANEALAPFRVLRGTECDIRADGSLDLPDDVLAELDWVQLSLHAGQRLPEEELTARVTEAMRHPAVRCLSHPKGRIVNHRPPNALNLERVFEVALEHGVAVETNGLPDRLDLRDEEVRLAIEAGVPVVCSTDAHSVRGLGNMTYSVTTARRGGATAADVLNTRPLAEILRT